MQSSKSYAPYSNFTGTLHDAYLDSSTKDCVLVEYRLHVPNVHAPGYMIYSVMCDSSRVNCSGKHSLTKYDNFYTDCP